MIPNETPQTLETSGEGVKIVGNFRITDATQARILVSLSDKMYTRKELAVIREYSTNAADAHIVAKKPVSDVIVTMPTMDDLNFRIRDFGLGLTEEKVANVYCVFGESDKRNSDEQNGMLGYGCKAGFAHADSFTVTSWVNGEKSIYQCAKGDATKLHSAVLLSRSPSDEPSGIEVCVPVKQSSLWTFHSEAARFYRHWPVIPTIQNLNDGDLATLTNFRNTSATIAGEGWEIRPTPEGGISAAVAYMGSVPYSIDWSVLSRHMALTAEKRVLYDLLQNNDVTLFFKMGEVQFVDSREQLEYTDFTIKALTERIDNIFNKVKDAIQSKFDSAPTIWEAKKLYNGVFGTGLFEVEKGEDKDDRTVERIRILNGNLMKLETVFKGTFFWNGIKLEDSSFKEISRFDNARPSEITKGYTPDEPVMTTFRKKRQRTKVNACTGDKNNFISASDAVAVVINDTAIRATQSLIARYLIFREGSKIRTVHVLKFVNDEIKGNFYKHFDFYTVPVLKISELLPEAKAWNATHKVSRRFTAGGGSGGGTRMMRFMDLETGRISTNEVPLREMEEGGVYIETGEGHKGASKVRIKNGYGLEDPDQIACALSTLAQKAGLDIDKVFIVGTQTKNSKWFHQAVESGVWKKVWDYIEEVDYDVDMPAIVDAGNFDASSILCKQAAELVGKHLTGNNSLMRNIIKVVESGDFDNNVEVADAFKTLGMWDKITSMVSGSFDFEAASEQVKACYPMLRHYVNAMINGHEYYLKAEVVAEVAQYINAMDVFMEYTEASAEPKLALA